MSILFNGVPILNSFKITFNGTLLKKILFNSIEVWNSLRNILFSASNTNSVSSELDSSKTLTLQWGTPTISGDASLLRIEGNRIYAVEAMSTNITCKFGGNKRSSGVHDGYSLTGRIYKNGTEIQKWSFYEDGTSGKFATKTWTLSNLMLSANDYIYVTQTITNRTSVSAGQSSVTIEGSTT